MNERKRAAADRAGKLLSAPQVALCICLGSVACTMNVDVALENGEADIDEVEWRRITSLDFQQNYRGTRRCMPRARRA